MRHQRQPAVRHGERLRCRALQELRKRRPVIAVGIAFATQEVDAVAADPHDERLDLVLTERELIDPRAR